MLVSTHPLGNAFHQETAEIAKGTPGQNSEHTRALYFNTPPAMVREEWMPLTMLEVLTFSNLSSGFKVLREREAASGLV